MTKSQGNLILHMLANAAVQGALLALFPDSHGRDIAQGLLTLAGVCISFYDQSHSQTSA